MPVRHRPEARRSRARRPGGRHAEGAGARRRGQHVLDVVRAAEGHLGHRADRLVRPRRAGASPSRPARTRPATTGPRRLNQRTRAGRAGASAAAPGSSALSTAQSRGLWASKIRALAVDVGGEAPVPVEVVRRHVQHRRHARPEGVHRLELEARDLGDDHAVGREGRAPRRPAACRCCRPPARAAPARPSSAPVSAVVVVLPLVPVMATNSASIARQASSSSPMIGTPRARAPASAGASTGTPGLTTTSSAVVERLRRVAAQDEPHALPRAAPAPRGRASPAA